MKEYIIGDVRYLITKNKKGLYDYNYQEYSEINKCWINITRRKDYTKEALEMVLDIEIDF